MPLPRTKIERDKLIEEKPENVEQAKGLHTSTMMMMMIYLYYVMTFHFAYSCS